MRASQARRAPFGGHLLAAVSLLLPGSPAFAANDADLPRSFDLEAAADIESVPPAQAASPDPSSAAQGSAALPDMPPEASAPAASPAAPPEGAGTAASAPETTVAAAKEEHESLLTLARHDLEALGPLSLGSPDAGLLVNPIAMPEGALWTIREASESYGTAETIDFVATAITAVEARNPGSPRLVIGDISRPDGGRLNRHRSHQAGRDVDLGFYYLRGECGEFKVARKGDLDLPRTWALVRALLTETDVERIFLDRALQRLLYAQALQEGEDRDWLDDVFGRLGDEERKGVIQHEKKHKNHLHVRFFNRVAQERARIVYTTLVETGNVPPPMVKHRVQRGETLGLLAARYGTSASAIRVANTLRGSRLRAGRGYLIPIRRVPEDNGPIVIPPRRLPPLATQAVDSTPASGLTAPAVVR
jgi:penicillin-insensitive murein endopeptidase